ncbi:MAG: hypothetical protein GY940_12185 [bacterium]|nr:hypothetical protein [bacterium]
MEPEPKKKKKPSVLDLKERLLRIFTALSNSLKKPLIDKLTLRGYSAGKINRMLSLHGQVMESERAVNQASAAQLGATESLGKRVKEVTAVYYKFRQLARVALEDEPTTLIALQLDSRPNRALTAFMAQVRLFYRAITTDRTLAGKLAIVNITPDEIQRELNLLDQLEQMNNTQEFNRKAVQDAKKKRNQLAIELEKQYSRFYKVAKVALAEEKQFLEMLDIRRRN